MNPRCIGHSVEIVLDGRALRVHYLDSGPSAGGRPALVMLHGSGPGACGQRNFSANIGYFVRLGYRVLAPDWPGWGQSDTLVCHGARSELNARILGLFLAAIGLREPVHLMGNSMGAHSAAVYAAHHPVASLALLGGGNGGRAVFQPAPSEGVSLIVDFYRQPDPERLRALLRAVVYDPSGITDALVAERFEAIMARPDHLESYRQSQQSCPLPYPDISARLPDIAAPTLVIWGREDRVVPVDIGLRVAALIPRCELHLFSQCGHVPHAEQAARFNSLLGAFLAS